MRVATKATPNSILEIRQKLFQMGNSLGHSKGRRRGTEFWLLTLSCGHRKEVKARRRRDTATGRSELDLSPSRTTCAECPTERGRHPRREVTEARLEVQR